MLLEKVQRKCLKGRSNLSSTTIQATESITKAGPGGVSVREEVKLGTEFEVELIR